MLTAAVDGPGPNGGAAAGADGQQTHQLVVFDEIDAHVGGEAAVAVAKLLRTQVAHVYFKISINDRDSIHLDATMDKF